MINDKISADAFKCMTVNLLLCILDAKSDAQEQARYREKLGTLSDANIEMLARLVRERKLLINRAKESSDTCGQYFQDAKNKTAYEMGQYWDDEYQSIQVRIDVEQVIQDNFNYVNGNLARAVFGDKAWTYAWAAAQEDDE